jgi:hypothetical protein
MARDWTLEVEDEVVLAKPNTITGVLDVVD